MSTKLTLVYHLQHNEASEYRFHKASCRNQLLKLL